MRREGGGPVIRRFRPGEEGALSALIRRTLREVNVDSPRGEVDYLIAHYTPGTVAALAARGHTYVLEAAGQAAGCGTVLPDGAAAEIAALYLCPEAMGRGYGRRLLETLEADPIAVRAGRLWLSASHMALGFYRHLGWAPVGRGPAPPGEDPLLYMEKPAPAGEAER